DIGDAGLDFTAPPGLQASVMAEAARLQAAQAARRTATLDEIRRGDPARSVLGAQVGKETQAWLREHAQAGPQAAGKPAAARAARRWWPALGALAGAAGVAVLSLQIVMRQFDLRDGAIVLPAEAPVKDKKNGPPSTPAMQADAASPAAQARQQPPQATPPQPAQAGSATRQPSQAARAEAPPPAASAQARSTPAAETRSEAAPQALAERAGPAPGSPTPAPAASGYADAPPAAAPAAPAMPAPPAMAQMAPMPPRAPIAAPVPPAPIAPPAA
ncbi:hypothetical protein P3W85_03150, partial [Cupriavidus basilensis]|nr:hypothetical protein [Cupriavidus basilensis]